MFASCMPVHTRGMPVHALCAAHTTEVLDGGCSGGRIGARSIGVTTDLIFARDTEPYPSSAHA